LEEGSGLFALQTVTTLPREAQGLLFETFGFPGKMSLLGSKEKSFSRHGLRQTIWLTLTPTVNM
jgi:hypothetical protein